MLNLTEMSYMKAEAWVGVRAVLLKLAVNLCKYATYLEHQCENSWNTTVPEGLHFHLETLMVLALLVDVFRYWSLMSKPTITARYSRLADALGKSADYKPVCVNTFAPVTPWRKYEYLKSMVLPVRVVKLTHSSPPQNMIFLWKVPATASATDLLNKSTGIRLSVARATSISHQNYSVRVYSLIW